MLAKNGTADCDLKIQVRSFCPFVETCPYLEEIRCAECLRYYTAFERMSKQSNIVRVSR